MAAIDEDVVAWRRHLHRHPEAQLRRARDGGVRGRDARRVRPGRRAADGDERDGTRSAAGGRSSRCGPTSTRCRSPRRAASSSPPRSRAGCTPAGTTGTRRCCSARRACCPSAACRRGEVRFLFQHGEELAPGGARDMVAAGVMDGVDFVYGCHLWAPLELGRVAAVPGPFMAAADFFRITITGRGGHAGLPHDRDRRDRRGRRGRRLAAARRGPPHRPARAGRGHDRQPPRGRRAERDPGTRRADRHGALVRRGRAGADPAADRGDRARRVRGARSGVLARLHVRLPAGRQ